MTEASLDAALPTGDPVSPKPQLTSLVVGKTGSMERLTVGDSSILLYPADALADGAAGLWLRRRTSEGIVPVSLIGQGTVTQEHASGLTPADRRGRWADLRIEVRLRRSEQQPAWYWHLQVTNLGLDPVELDLVHAQDVALAPLAAVRTNEYYVSQYLDLTPVDVPAHGVALGVRQNMPGPTRWLLVGCLGQADGWATDAIQLTGRGRSEGAPWPGLAADLPNTRVQGEHTLAALQTRPVVLEPDGTWTSGFYGLFVADHPEATSADDARHAVAALADPAASWPPASPVGGGPPAGPVDGGPEASPGDGTPPVSSGEDHRSLFGEAPTLRCRPLTEDELDRLTGSYRRQVERDSDELLSFFTADGTHVVTGAKQARVLRPHGHLLRSGTSLTPEERSICTTVWMDGTFCSQLTQGHVSLGAILSVRRSYLGLAPAQGLRIFVRADDAGWMLLGTPSAWSVSLEECRWWYASDAGLLQVTTRVRAETDQVDIEVEVLAGPAVELLTAAHVPWLDLEGPVGSVAPEPDGVRIFPPRDSTTEQLFPGGSLHLGWTPGSAEPGDDGALFLDARSRALPWVTVRAGVTRQWRLTLTPSLVPPDPNRSPEPGFWSSTARAVTLQPPDTAAGRELERIAAIVPWFTHDALIHYLSPRGLEQYSGGAWGTRDVSQGPVGLLLTLGAHDDLRRLVLTVLRAQFAGGDWPQAFDFLDRHRHDGPSESHGDVVYWPLLALGDYLAATGDDTILAEEVGFAGGPGSAPVADHVRAALGHIDSTLIAGTSLPAYGHGDWNDSLQPVHPALAARLCSTWTGVLQAHALGVLGRQLEGYAATRDLGERATRLAHTTASDVRRLLLVDGVLAGYGLFSGAEVEPLIHPGDARTGLSYSILAMIHAISADLLTPEEARSHLRLIRDHLLGPDGARLFDRPVGYQGGPMTLFQRAEASTFFGREIGIMYVHAHLRYAEALARVGDGPGLLRALALAQPVGVTDRVPSARPRQSTCYFSSSDAAFPDRYAARDGYAGVLDGTVPLEGGWRVYSSGPGLFLRLLVQHQLGLRVQGDRVHLDPVLDPDLDGLAVQVPLLGSRRRVRFTVGPLGHGVRAVRVTGASLDLAPLSNPYRRPGVSVGTAELRAAFGDSDEVLEIETG